MAKVYQKSGGPTVAGRKPWFIDWFDVGGRRHRERTDATTKAEAEALLRVKLSENTKAEILGVQSTDGVKPIAFAAFFERQYLPYIQTRVRPSTYKRKEQLGKHLVKAFGSFNLRSIDAGQIERFIEARSKSDPKPSPAEVNRERSLLSSIMNTAFRRGLVDINQVSRVRPLREENQKDLWLTRDEVEAILGKAEAWMRPIIILGVHMGMREAEVSNLGWPDVDHSPGWVRVGHESKSGKPRFIPINRAALAALQGQTRHIGPAGRIAWVFVNPDSIGPGKSAKPFNRFSVCHAFKRAALAAAKELMGKGDSATADRLSASTFHTTRHTFASWSIQAGIPLAEVQQYLGHSTDTMTRRYAHLAPASKERRNALEALVVDDANPQAGVTHLVARTR